MRSKNITLDHEQIIEELRTENELKTKWLSLIAHDFKGLSSNIKFLLDAMDDQSITPEVFMSMLPELKQISEKNSKTIQSTFAWVNAQICGFRIDKEPILIHNLYLEIVESFDKAIAAKELSFEYKGNTSLSVNTDRFLLRFIIKELVENSIKYSNKGDIIELITNSESNVVSITLKDNGVGMKSSRLNTIGTLNDAPYTGTLQEKGAGLSLVIVKDFVEMINGTMMVSSVEGVGTKVKIELRDND